MNTILSEIQILLERLSSREKMIVLGVTAGIVLLAIVVSTAWVNGEIVDYKTEIAKQKQNFDQIVDLRDRYKTQEGKAVDKSSDIKGNRVNLHSLVGSLLEKHSLDYRSLSMARGRVDRDQEIREETVKVELQKVDLGKLLLLLREIGAKNPLVFVKSISMKRRYDNKEQIDATFHVATLKPLSG